MNIILQNKAMQGKNRGRLIVTKFKLLREQCNEIVTKNKTYRLFVVNIEDSDWASKNLPIEVNKWLKY